jgi:triphosphatase
MATETELKLAITENDAAKVGRQAVVRNHANGNSQRRHLTNTYFDTPDLRLAEHGVALRLRRQGGRWLQTLKTAGNGTAGLHRRGEWEDEVEGEALDFTKLTDTGLHDLFAEPEVRERLAPVFTTDFWRTTWDLHFPDGSEVELAIDRGQVRSGKQETPISEVELELKSGSPSRLFEVAHALAEALPMRLSDISKAERGYRLLAPAQAPAGTRAKGLGLDPQMSAEDALCSILWHTMEHLQANEPVVLENPSDIEGVHQMRVATRRLRSALTVFRPLVPREVSGALGEEVKWLTNALGPARDWDVFISETLDPLQAHFPEHGSLAKLAGAAHKARAAAYEEAQAAVRSGRYTRLLLGLAAWMERRDWRDVVSPEQLARLDKPVGRFASKVIGKRHRQVLRKGEDFQHLTTEERHQLRILCKKLRYASEFFVELYPKKPAKAFIKGLSRLQDTLGVLNDSAVAHHLIEQITTNPQNAGANLVYGFTTARAHCHLAEFDAAWKAFEGKVAFWR